MESNTFTTTTTYVSIVAAIVTDWSLQNTGGHNIEVIFDDTDPLETAKGMIIKPGNGMTSASFGTGQVWAKIQTGNDATFASTVIVVK